MSDMIKTYKTWLITALVAAVLLPATLFALGRWDRPDTATREIVLLARDVSFWEPHRPLERNPSLHLRRGQPVRLILQNQDPDKVLHCFTIGALEVKSTRDLAGGQSEALTFTPTQTGTFTYACLMHPAMAGKVVVE